MKKLQEQDLIAQEIYEKDKPGVPGIRLMIYGNLLDNFADCSRNGSLLGRNMFEPISVIKNLAIFPILLFEKKSRRRNEYLRRKFVVWNG